jgi:RHS repeat-associated protein
MDYYPFGMQLDKQFANHDNKYLYNGKELQDDEFENGFKLDWYDYGARMYDAQIGRWLSLDPLAGEYFTFSPFCYSLNNPLRFIDPNGAWVVSIKDGKIVLTPEEDDDYDSFQEFFGNIENAQYFINNEDIAGIKNGEISELTFNETNVFSQAVKYAYENPGEFESAENENSYFSDKLSEAGERSYQWRQKHGEGNYNCHSSSINGSQRNPLDKYGEMNTNDRDKILQSQFVSVTQNESIFGKTVISFGPLHDALFFGKSRDGITFIFSKNGPITEPQIMPLKVLIKREQYGGQVKDFNTLKVSGDLGTGHRNPKK